MAEKKIVLPVSRKEIVARTPKVKDMKLVDNIPGEIERETTLIGNLCQMSPQEVDDLEFKDYQKLQKELLL